MKTLKVADMHCQKCVQRISNALEEAGIGFEISLENKTVTVEESKAAAAATVLDDLGFDAE